jgi:hypothetical protein
LLLNVVPCRFPVALISRKTNTEGQKETKKMFPLERCPPEPVGRERFSPEAVSNLLKALALISEMYRDGKRTLPLKPPTAFIRRAWRPFVFKDGDIDRRAYEACVFSELRNRLRARDMWVDRSRQYQDFETYLIPKLTFEMLKAEGPL